MKQRLGRLINRGTLAFNAWLGSTAGFVQSIIITLAWVPLIVYSIDPHGFLYLYVATSFSMVTQFSVAIYARHLEAGQKKFEKYVRQMLQNQVDMTKLMLGEVSGLYEFDDDLGHIQRDIEEIMQELGMEQHHVEQS